MLLCLTISPWPSTAEEQIFIIDSCYEIQSAYGTRTAPKLAAKDCNPAVSQ
jgi:hypothetical protein